MATTPNCVVVDYGIGNVFSVMHALEKCGAHAELTSDHAKILAADRVILPGVGAFGRAMERLRAVGLDDLLHRFIETERPFLGICVGMQVLMETGFEFGEHDGLGVFEGTVAKIDICAPDGEKIRVPIVGWNTVVSPAEDRWSRSAFDYGTASRDFYFVHSFSVEPRHSTDILATVPVGVGHVVAAIRRGNVTGVQFHPERSAEGGQAFLKGFLTQ